MSKQITDDASQVAAVYHELRNSSKSQATLDISFRKNALKTLLKGYEEMIPIFDQALKKDLGLNTFMANFLAHSITKTQIQVLIDNLDSWSKPVSVPTPVALGFASSQIQYEPLGLVLVLAPWNYPIYCAIPLVAAGIAAGNSVILKPSQIACHCSNALKLLFDKYMNQNYYRVIEGKAEVSKTLCQQPFDLICFTGSSATGRLVAIQAAKNLTPCLLELGGKCPTIIDESANLESAAMRLLFAKLVNSGQTCVAADHVYVHESVKNQFQKILLEKVDSMYGNSVQLVRDGNYPKIINTHHLDRLEGLLNDKHDGKIIYGGVVDRDELFMSPTIVDEPRVDSHLMKQEIFGPILPILSYNNLQSLIRQINLKPKPLVVYLFSQNTKNIATVRKTTFSGAFVLNDGIIHMLSTHLPFGGVGKSGYGRWSGKSGFQSFSNLKSVCLTKAINIYPLTQRFPPYTDSKKSTMTNLLKISTLTYGQVGKALLYIAIVGSIAAYKLAPRL